MGESGERVVDERLRAINKKTGKYVDLIKRTIYDDTPFPIVKYLNYSYDELNYDYVRYLALQRAGIPIDAYYASEIDNTCIKVSQKHFPDIIRLGDVNNWRTWDIPWKDIDLVMGGFCCQSFSSSGKGKGFMDARGRLFFCFSDIVRHLKKETKGKILFLGENVRMRDEHRRVITEELGVEPVEIDSAWCRRRPGIVFIGVIGR